MYQIIPGKTLPEKFKIEVNDHQMFDSLVDHLKSIGFVNNFYGSLNFARYIEVTNYSLILNLENWPNFQSCTAQVIKFKDYFEPITDSIPLPTKLSWLLENMTQEEFDKAWEEIKNLRLIGPTIEEYLKRK